MHGLFIVIHSQPRAVLPHASHTRPVDRREQVAKVLGPVLQTGLRTTPATALHRST
jgi:hypothetical protein